MNTPQNKFRLISQNAPEKYVITMLNARDVCLGSERFFDENFRGSILFEMPESVNGYVIASADGIAYFFKVLLNAIFGDSTVKVRITSDKELLYIRTEWKSKKEISSEDLSELERVARVSAFGFEISHGADVSHLDIFLSIQTLSYLPLYAFDVEKMHEAFVRVFFLI